MKFHKQLLLACVLVAVFVLHSLTFANHSISADSRIDTARSSTPGYCDVAFSAYTKSSSVASQVTVFAKIYHDNTLITRPADIVFDGTYASVGGNFSRRPTGWWEIIASHEAFIDDPWHTVQKVTTDAEYCSGGIT